MNSGAERALSDLLHGFPPIWRADARVLVLGSMPSAESLRRQEYYGHPRNAFWRIVGTLFGTPPGLDYHGRVAALQHAGVALWDVCGACRRSGSADASIRDAVPNDIAGLVARTPSALAIACNGAKAHDLFERRVAASLPACSDRPIEVVRLPSTSPAYAALSETDKLAAWRILLDWTDRDA